MSLGKKNATLWQGHGAQDASPAAPHHGTVHPGLALHLTVPMPLCSHKVSIPLPCSFHPLPFHLGYGAGSSVCRELEQIESPLWGTRSHCTMLGAVMSVVGYVCHGAVGPRKSVTSLDNCRIVEFSETLGQYSLITSFCRCGCDDPGDKQFVQKHR